MKDKRTSFQEVENRLKSLSNGVETDLQKCMEQMTCLGVEKTPKILKMTNTTTSNYIRHLNWGFID